ncbi:MAG: sulfite exporter TauE/SafE family protein [Alphaproteobacteria bacterium]
MDHETALVALLDAGFERCHASVSAGAGPITSLFLAGLAGSLGHCALMCGPFVLSQVTARLEGVPASSMREWHRLAGAALVPYHLGRATTYAGLGVLAAALAGSLTREPGLKWVSAALLAMAALLMVVQALPGLGLAVPGARGPGVWWGERVSGLVRPLFRDPTGLRGYALGLALGFIPCGLLYAALTAAAATGDMVAGGIGMLAFAAGTSPGLVAAGLAGHVAAGRWRTMAVRAAPLLSLLNAGLLGVMAWRLIA